MLHIGGVVPKTITSGFRTSPDIGWDPLIRQLHDLTRDTKDPVRLNDLSRYPAAHRTLRRHLPRAHGLLVVPIRKGPDLQGYLCVVSEEQEPQFTTGDEHTVATLVSATYSAIENVELHDSQRRRHGWPDIATEVAKLLLGEVDLDRAMRLVTQRLRDLAGADCTAIALTDPADPDGALQGILEWSRMCAVHIRLPRRGMVGEALQRGRPVIVDDAVLEPGADLLLDWAAETAPIGTAMFIPLVTRDHIVGVLFSGWRQDAPLAECAKAEKTLVSIFAEQITPVLQRVEQQRLGVQDRLTEDREQLAGKLCNVAMERMLAISTQLHSIEGRSTDSELRQRLTHEVGQLDDSLQQLRATIFGIDVPDPHPSPTGDEPQPSVSDSLLHELDSSLTFLGFVPRLVIQGSLCNISPRLGVELTNAVRESLASAAPFSPRSVEVVVRASATHLNLQVTDDAQTRGPDRATCPAELRARANRLGGTCTCRTDGRHNILNWTIPTGSGTVGAAARA
nr:GAF domain-containing protein [Actinopolymorpha cephalotaxi]